MLASPAHLYMPYLFTHCLPTIICVMLMSMAFFIYLFFYICCGLIVSYGNVLYCWYTFLCFCFYELKFFKLQQFQCFTMILINLINNDAFVSAATANTCFVVHLVCLFMKTRLLVLLQDSCLDLVCCAFLHKLFRYVRNSL